MGGDLWDLCSIHCYPRTCNVGLSCCNCQVFTFLHIEEHSPFSCQVSSVIQIPVDSIEQIDGGLLPVLYTDVSFANMEQSLEKENWAENSPLWNTGLGALGC